MNIQEEYISLENNCLENFEEENRNFLIGQNTLSHIGQAMPIFCV